MRTGGPITSRQKPLKAAAIAAATLGLLITTSCTSAPAPQEAAVENPTKVLQNVHVQLSGAAGVQAINGTVVSVGADGASSSASTDYATSEVVGDLPVRATLRYTAKDKSGSDLADLKGYSGPLQVDVTLENLTVHSTALQYDVNGTSRTSNALVGAPLTVAASTTLNGVRPNDVTAGSADGSEGTNGVLSSTQDGSAVVQWATILAPPQSGASSTLRLVANVKDFTVPTVDIAIQPGLSTDLSGEGVVASALNTSDSSEMALQRRTISLVSDVAEVMTKAGATITDVRKSLETSATTLGVKTAGELKSNSEALARTMKSLKGELGNLRTSLESATTSAQSATTSQLTQTVSSIDAMLGDTSATPGTATIKGANCSATVAKPPKSSTVYSSLLAMSSQLEAYATVNAGCRDLVVSALKTSIGPEKPTLEECKEQGSLTCSLYGSAAAVTVALYSLVEKSDDLVAELQPELVTQALTEQGKSNTLIAKAREQISAIVNDDSGATEYDQSLKDLEAAVTAARGATDASKETLKGITAAIDTAEDKVDLLRKRLTDLKPTAEEATNELTGGRFANKSMKAQNQDLADRLCALGDGDSPANGRLSDAQVERLRSYLTAEPCEATDETGAQNPPLDTPWGYSAPLDERLDDQASRWDTVDKATDTSDADTEIGEAFSQAKDAVKTSEDSYDDIVAKLDAVDEAVKKVDGAATGHSSDINQLLKELDSTLDSTQETSTELTAALEKLKKQQDGLGDTLKSALTGLSAATVKQVLDATQTQARAMAEVGDRGSEAVIAAFNNSVNGLRSTSNDVVEDAKDTVDQQRGELKEQAAGLASAMDKTTEASLKSIAASTSASSKDVEGARALLSSSLNKVMLDLGDRKVKGSGLIGSMTTNSAKAGTADYQMALATQNAQGYANIRAQDVSGLLLRQAQFKASLTAADELPAFHYEVPASATHQTLYTLSIGGEK
jgi:ABC-type transporter Mla subunit MlaD